MDIVAQTPPPYFGRGDHATADASRNEESDFPVICKVSSGDKMFDSSVTRGKPAEFPLNRVIAGWTEGLQLMVVGEKTRFWIPEDLAYRGRPGRPSGMLVVDIELLEMQ